MAKISVCVVTYNQAAYIADCLQSIVDQQTAFPFEVLVADDCSTDGTRAIVERFAADYPALIRLEARPRNLGAFANFIAVHNAAQGAFVAHIDGDDLMLPGKLEQQAAFLQSHEQYAVVWHRMNLFDGQGNVYPGEEYDYGMFPDGEVRLEHALRLGSVCAHSAIMYRRSARITREVQFPTLDLFFTWEYLMAGRGKILDAVLGEYRVLAKGSIRTAVNLRKLNAQHARHYLNLLPGQKKNIFIFALVNLLVDLKNRRPSARDFLQLAWDARTPVSPRLLLTTLRQVRRLVIKPLRAGTPGRQNGGAHAVH